MKLSNSQLGQLVYEAIRAGTVNLNATLLALQAVQPEAKETIDLKIIDYKLKVNYDLKLKKIIKAGKYNWKNSDITDKHFPVKNKGEAEVEMKLIHFSCIISSKDAIAEMDKLGLKPANPVELMKLGEKYPDLQKKFPILALGQSWTDPDGGRHLVGLGRDGSGRSLRLYWYYDNWPAYFRFLAVKTI